MENALSPRYPAVGYGFESATAGVLRGIPAGLIPWDGDFGQIVENQPDPRGLDRTDFLSLYEVAFAEWLGSVFQVGKVRIPVVFAAPKQAFASYWSSLPPTLKANLLRSCGGSGPDLVSEATPAPPNLQLSRYPLPFASFFRTGTSRRDGHNAVPIRNLKFLDKDRTHVGWSKFPTPYELEFQVSVWSKYRAMHNWFFAMFDSGFSQELGYLLVPNQLADGGESVLGAVTYKRADETMEEATEDSETVFRWVFTVSVEARRYYEVRAAPVSQGTTVTVTEYHNNGAGSTRLT